MGFKKAIQQICRTQFGWNIRNNDAGWPAVRLMVTNSTPASIVEQFRTWASSQSTLPADPLSNFVSTVNGQL